MSELGRHLQFPIRTFHKPNYLKEFTTRLGLYACKEQRGKTVVVCVHAPQKLLDEYRQSHAPTGPWLQNGWLNAVHNAMDTSLAGLDAPADPAVPIITATPLEGGPSLAQGSGMDEPPQQQPQQQQLEAQSGQQAEQSMSAKGCVAVEGMPTIPEAAEAQVDSGEEAEIAQKGQIAAERRQMAEEEMQTMQPWISDQSKIALDRIRRLLEQLDDAGFLFKSALRRFLKVLVNSDTVRTVRICMSYAGSTCEEACS